MAALDGTDDASSCKVIVTDYVSDGSADSGLTNLFSIADGVKNKTNQNFLLEKKHRAAQRICSDVRVRPRWVTLMTQKGCADISDCEEKKIRAHLVRDSK